MIVRQLRPDENIKCNMLQSTAFNYSYNAEEHKEDKLSEEAWGAFLDDGETLMSVMCTITYRSRFGGCYLPALGIGGVATYPQYRRSGGIRAIFRKVFSMAPERGWAISYLYPFSFDYYRQFGYERVLRRKEMKFDCSMLERIPRNTNAVLYENTAQQGILLDIYRRFSAQMNLIFDRPDDGRVYREYSADPHKSLRYTYIWSDDAGHPESYATCSIRNEYLCISELCYTSPEALYGILGFLRMYDGQVKGYHFTDLPENTPLEYLMGNYWNVDYTLDSFAMGRVLLPETLFRTYDYPDGDGAFTIAVCDDAAPHLCRGTYAVSFSGGHGSCEKISAQTEPEADLVLNTPVLSRLLLGSETLTTASARYVPGVEIRCDERAGAFFRAFTRRSGHIYTRF